jgi:hypothetical protein
MTTQAFQYSVLRYVADVVRNEPVNIGVIVRDQTTRETAVKTLPLATVSRKAGKKAVALTLALEENLRASPFELFGSAAMSLAPQFFDDARREFHGNLQLSEPRGVMAEDIEKAVERLYASHVAEPRPAPAVEGSTAVLSPSKMRDRLWSAFNRVELFAPGKARKEFSVRGRHATWKFDVGYRNGKLSLVNALAIGTDNVQTNLDRALLYKGMIAEVRDESKDEIHPIAVISAPPSRGAARRAYIEAHAILTDAKIDTFALQDVGALALQAQRVLDVQLTE